MSADTYYEFLMPSLKRMCLLTNWVPQTWATVMTGKRCLYDWTILPWSRFLGTTKSRLCAKKTRTEATTGDLQCRWIWSTMTNPEQLFIGCLLGGLGSSPHATKPFSPEVRCLGTTKSRLCAKKTRTEANTGDPGEILNFCELTGHIYRNNGEDWSCSIERYNLARQPLYHDVNGQWGTLADAWYTNL